MSHTAVGGMYDISDYQGIDPVFATLADFDALLHGIHERGMKLVMDLVVNDTSDEHLAAGPCGGRLEQPLLGQPRPHGDFTMLLPDDGAIHVFTRRLDDVELLVLGNFSPETVIADVPSAPDWAQAQLLLVNYAPYDDAPALVLRPW